MKGRAFRQPLSTGALALLRSTFGPADGRFHRALPGAAATTAGAMASPTRPQAAIPWIGWAGRGPTAGRRGRSPDRLLRPVQGRMIGQWLGLRAPERIRKLILANTSAYMSPPSGWPSRISGVLVEGMSPLTEASISRWFTPAVRVIAGTRTPRPRSAMASGWPIPSGTGGWSNWTPPTCLTSNSRTNSPRPYWPSFRRPVPGSPRRSVAANRDGWP